METHKAWRCRMYWREEKPESRGHQRLAMVQILKHKMQENDSYRTGKEGMNERDTGKGDSADVRYEWRRNETTKRKESGRILKYHTLKKQDDTEKKSKGEMCISRRQRGEKCSDSGRLNLRCGWRIQEFMIARILFYLEFCRLIGQGYQIT